MIAFVEQPSAIATVIAFSNALRVRIFAGTRSSHTMSTMRRPHCVAMRWWLESTAGMLDAPGSVMPSASAMPIIVAAVHITMHVPAERAMLPSISIHCASVILPARRSSQNFHESDPEPSTWPFQLPRGGGPAGGGGRGGPGRGAPGGGPGGGGAQ